MIELYIYWFEWFLIGWMGALFVLVAFRFLRGKISARGILLRRSRNNRYDPERLTLLVSTLGIALYYVVNTLGTSLDEMTVILAGGEKSVTMPDIPVEGLYLLFGAQSSYVTGKIFRLP